MSLVDTVDRIAKKGGSVDQQLEALFAPKVTIEQLEAKEMVRHQETMRHLKVMKQMQKVVDERFISRTELASFLGYASVRCFTKRAEKIAQSKGYIPKYEQGYLLKDAQVLRKNFLKGGRRVQISKIKTCPESTRQA